MKILLPELKKYFSFILFWLLFFALYRVLFILNSWHLFSEISWTEIAITFWYGFKMDLSITAYFALIPILFWSILLYLPNHYIPLQWFRGYMIFLISIVVISGGFDFHIYREWGTKLNYRALEFAFGSPGEAYASISSSPIVSSVLLGLFMAGVGLTMAYFLINEHKESIALHPLLKALIIVVIIGCNFLMMRGGWKVVPMNLAVVYHSEKQILNHSAVNTQWSLMQNFLESRTSNKNPFEYITLEEARPIIEELYTVEADTVSVLNATRPNVVLILLESFTADIVKSLGGEAEVTPFLEELIEDGLLFSNIYASGDRSDKGLVAIISGFPTQARKSIIMQNEKADQLPSISKSLLNDGYTTSFFYGGELEFSNFKTYLFSQGYVNLYSKNDFSRKDVNSKWGAHDNLVFARKLKELDTTTQPFLSTILTLSNHEPFEIPTPPQFPGADLPNKFRSTAYFTDQSLKEFMQEAKTKDWYANTLFVIVADHGHRLPKEFPDPNYPGKFRIPLIFYGDVLKDNFKGQRNETIGSQTDIAKTLLTQLKINSNDFNWSKDLLNPKAKNFAFYSFDGGFGWINENGKFTFDNIGEKLLYTDFPVGLAPSIQEVKTGQAYMKLVYQQMLDY